MSGKDSGRVDLFWRDVDSPMASEVKEGNGAYILSFGGTFLNQQKCSYSWLAFFRYNFSKTAQSLSSDRSDLHSQQTAVTEGCECPGPQGAKNLPVGADTFPHPYPCQPLWHAGPGNAAVCNLSFRKFLKWNQISKVLKALRKAASICEVWSLDSFAYESQSVKLILCCGRFLLDRQGTLVPGDVKHC